MSNSNARMRSRPAAVGQPASAAAATDSDRLEVRRCHEHRPRRNNRWAALADQIRQARLAKLGVKPQRQRRAVQAEAETVTIEQLDRRGGCCGRHDAQAVMPGYWGAPTRRAVTLRGIGAKLTDGSVSL